MRSLLILPPGGSIFVPIRSNGMGTLTLTFDLSGIKAGTTGCLQAVWANPIGACTKKDLVSTSNGLQLTVQK